MGDQFVSRQIITRLPKWVRWLAQDADGAWWAYENEPNESHSGWYENEVGLSIKIQQGEANNLWRESLTRVDKI